MDSLSASCCRSTTKRVWERADAGVLRRDSLLATLRLAIDTASRHIPRPLRFFGRLFANLYERLASRYPAILADAYVALNFGRDHLIQYLHYLRKGAQATLTARA